ncbi:MAG: L-ribulose-5-phosphate 4-epimerase [Alistipes sp.]|nr:L-ribulose-5-phosphate 4-epimerase [Alistipes sp.]
MLEDLKKSVCQANLDLVRHGLVVLTWGNVSAIDRQTNLVVIKPSGVSYDNMKAEDMVVVDLDGNVIDGNLRPSSDTPTHLEIYKAFKEVGAVVHTHSTCATAWAQACREIPNLGTTHADTFYHAIPCTAEMTKAQIEEAYEANTGVVIREAFEGINPMHTPAVLVAHHGPFTWGKSAKEAVQNSVILEEVAKMATMTLTLNPSIEMNGDLVEKHYNRKHGANAYYGQK